MISVTDDQAIVVLLIDRELIPLLTPLTITWLETRRRSAAVAR